MIGVTKKARFITNSLKNSGIESKFILMSSEMVKIHVYRNSFNVFSLEFLTLYNFWAFSIGRLLCNNNYYQSFCYKVTTYFLSETFRITVKFIRIILFPFDGLIIPNIELLQGMYSVDCCSIAGP